MKSSFLLFLGIVRRRPARLIMTALCTFACFLAYFGLSFADTTIERSERNFFDECGRADLIVSSENCSAGELKKEIKQNNAVLNVNEAYIFETKGICADGKTRTVRFFGLEKFDIIHPITDGADFSLSCGYISEYGAQNVSFIRLEGGSDINVSGICRMPAYMYVYADRVNVSTDGDIVDIYTDIKNIKEISGKNESNYAFVTLKSGADKENTAAMLKADGEILKKYVISFEDEASVAASRRLGETVRGICGIFPYVIFGIGIIFICIFLSEVVISSRKTAAVLLTDGASPFDILTGFFISSLTSLLSGMLLSCAPSLILAEAVSKTTLRNMGIPYSSVTFEARFILYGILICIFISAASCALCSPLLIHYDIIRLKINGKNKTSSDFADIFKTCICSAAAVVLILTTCMYRDSLSAVRKELFFERNNYDAQIIYSSFVPTDELENIKKINGVTAAEPLAAGAATLKYKNKSCAVFGNGLSENSEMLTFSNPSGEKISPVPNQIILSEKTAKTLGASIGDIINAEITYGKERIDIMCLISDISKQSSSFCQIVSIDTVTQYLDSSGLMNAALVKLSDIKEEDFISEAKKEDSVYTVQLKKSAVNRFDNRYSGTVRLSKLIIYNGIMLGIFIFAITGYSTWRKNLKKNSVLIMLGESSFKIAAKDLARQLSGTILGFSLGCVLSIFLEEKILLFLSGEEISYPLVIRPETFAFSAAVILSCSFISVICYAAATLKRSKDIL